MSADAAMGGDPENYPRECFLCNWESALACADAFCRERRFGEHREDCETAADEGAACTCLREVEPQ